MSTRGDEIDQDAYEEYVPLRIPPDFRELQASDGKLSVREFWNRYVEGQVLVEPDFQRHYVWDATRASRFVESLLLRLPTPPVFVSEDAQGRWTVIDGHQRLETLFRFMRPLLAGTVSEVQTNGHLGRLSPLSLTHLEILENLNGRGVTALSREDRQRLWDAEVGYVRLPPETHPDMRYVLFARLNLGSMSLNAQELRNCLYRGPYNDLIARLSEAQPFLRLWGRASADKRMHDRELVLRFFAFLHRVDRYRQPFRAFLNDEMEANRELEEFSAADCRAAMETAATWVERIFDKEAFRLFRLGDEGHPPGRWGSRRYDLVYELEMVGFAQYGPRFDKLWNAADRVEREHLKLRLRSRLIDVMTNPRLADTMWAGTTRPEAIDTRMKLWTGVIKSVAEEDNDAIELAREIHDHLRRTNVCSICPHPMTPDDAVWASTGGSKRLAHRYCRSAARGARQLG